MTDQRLSIAVTELVAALKEAIRFIFMVRMGFLASYGVNFYFASKIYTLEGSPSFYMLMGLLVFPIVVMFIFAPSWRRGE